MYRACLLLFVLLASAACSNGGSGGSDTPTPTATPTPTGTATPTPTPTPVLLASSFGQEFFAVDLDNVDPGLGVDDGITPIVLTVVNTDTAANAHIVVSTATNGSLTQVDVGPGALGVIPLPRADLDGTGIFSRAFRVTSDRPVGIQQLNPSKADVTSSDASLLLPVATLGSDYTIVAAPHGPLASFATVIAVDAAPTTVYVTPTISIPASGGVPALTANTESAIVLSRFDAVNLETSSVGQDLTGTRIRADRPVSVFAGAECVVISPANFCTHLEEQMFPRAAAGATHVAVRSPPRLGSPPPDRWRVLAFEATTLTYDPPQAGAPASLAAGAFAEFTSSSSFVMTASQPVLLVQFVAGFSNGDSDSTFVTAIPTDGYSRRSLVSLPDIGYADRYLSITAPAGATVLLDGAPLTGFATIGSWQHVTTLAASGRHEVTSEVPIGVQVVGFSSQAAFGAMGALNLP